MPPRQAITTKQRIALRKYAFEHPHLRQSQLRQWFESTFSHKISQSTISESLSAKFKSLDTVEEVYQPHKRRRLQDHPQLEQALFLWHQKVEVDIPISDGVLREKAIRLWGLMYPDTIVPTFSNGWLSGFKKRYNIRQQIRHGEAGSLNLSAIAEQLRAVQSLVQQYHPSDVYNCDETGLFWKHTPDRGLATQQRSGTKKNKARITAHFCCNSDGSDKIRPWFIGHALKPRCFGAANVHFSSLDCVWKSNSNAWMTTPIMAEWLLAFDRHVASKGRKVLLLMDNFSAHEAATNLLAESNSLCNTIICFLPPNSTSKTQPLDQGIINSFKAHYRRRWLQYMVDEFDEGLQPLRTMNVLKAIRWSIQSWSDISAATIANCWRHAGLTNQPPQVPLSQEIAPAVEVTNLIDQLVRQQRIHTVIAIESFLNPQDEEVTDIPQGNLEEDIAAQFMTQLPQEEEHRYESDEDNEEVPIITHKEALYLIQRLSLYEEQQEHGQHSLLSTLSAHQMEVKQRRQRGLQQRPISSFFSASNQGI